MKCPTCGGDAELLKQPCCETAWADHVVSHPSDAVAALQRADYDGAIKLGLEQLTVGFAVVTAARVLRGENTNGFAARAATMGAHYDVLMRLVEKLRASVGRTAGAAVSSAEQHTISTEGRLALSWRGRLRAALFGYLDIEVAVQTERLAGRSSWRWRVVD
jgi:hypothetical protein